VDVDVSQRGQNDVDELDMEAQEDILMLKAHMGHFDHMLNEGENAVHMIEREIALPSSPIVKRAVESISRPSIGSGVIELSDDDGSDDEPMRKGDSVKRKKRRATSSLVIDLEDEDSNEEEDLDVMKMKKYPSSNEMEAPTAMPIAKRRQTEEIDHHVHQPISLSAPSTPINDTFKRAMLSNTGRYYDDSTLNTQVKTCRFCAKTYGVPYRAPSNRLACFICGGSHIARECPNMLCYNCWELGHRSGNCKNQRMPKTTCFRCGGHHDALDCLHMKGIQRMGSGMGNSKSNGDAQRAIPLPALCCNCGHTGHVARDCRQLSMEDTTKEAERDPQAWYHRRKTELERENRQAASSSRPPQRPRSHSHTGNQHTHKNRDQQSPGPQQHSKSGNKDPAHSTPARSKSPSSGNKHHQSDQSRSAKKKQFGNATPKSGSKNDSRRAPSSNSKKGKW
jgi:hypothetical protein